MEPSWLASRHLIFKSELVFPGQLVGMKLAVVPNKPMGFPTKNDHFGVWNGGTSI